MQPVIFPKLVRVRVALAPRMQPFDEAMDSINAMIRYAMERGYGVSLEKVRRGCPGFQNYGPVLAHMLEAGDTHLLVAADDVLFPVDAIVRLIEADKDVVNGIYRKNMIYQLTPANHCETWEDFAEKFKAGGVHETQFACGHSLTIKRQVIEKMIADYPELKYKQGDETHSALFLPMILDGICYQDDWAFSHRARQSGFTLWDDYDCKLKHFCYDFLGFEHLEAQHGGI